VTQNLVICRISVELYCYIDRGIKNYIITSFLEGLVALVGQQLEGSSGQRTQAEVHQGMLVAEKKLAGTQSCSADKYTKSSLSTVEARN